MYIKPLAALIILFAFSCACSPTWAESYVPDITELDGTSTLEFSDLSELNLSQTATIEFWVAPGWTEDPDYDPVIVCEAGEEGLSYLIAMLRDRDGLAIATGDGEDDEEIITFDFTDGQMHHVAIVQLTDGLVVLVDGQVVGSSEMRLTRRPGLATWVGSINGQDNVFTGAIAGPRFWGTAVAQTQLVEYALKDVFAGPHPNLESLVAISEFTHADGPQLLVIDQTDT